MTGREELVGLMSSSDSLQRQWGVYASKHSYASGIVLQDAIEAVELAADAAEEGFLSAMGR